MYNVIPPMNVHQEIPVVNLNQESGAVVHYQMLFAVQITNTVVQVAIPVEVEVI